MTFQTFTAREYLKIDIANNFGLEKADWNDRLAWFDQHEHCLLEMLHKAEEPALFYAGVKAWEEVKAGKPTGYMISLDATSSGLQLLAALTGDLRAAQLCNVVDTGHREDAYTNVYATMLSQLDESGKITRDMAKDAIMTSLYGSTAVPKRVFGEGNLLDVFYFVMENIAPAAWELNQAFLAIWDPEALSNDWVLPDNFHVHIKVMDQVKERVHFLNQPFDVFYKVNQPMSDGRSLGANTIHSIDGMIVREITRRCDYDPKQLHAVIDAFENPKEINLQHEKADMCRTLWKHYEESGYLSARILDYLVPETSGLVSKDVIYELISTFPEKPFKVVSIHDCFRVHPNYGNDLRKQYNLQLAMIAKSNLLSYLISQIVKRPVTIGKLHQDMHKDIVQSNYALS